MSKELVIKIEGMSGSGKTVVGRSIAAFLKGNGFEVEMEDDIKYTNGSPVDLNTVTVDELDVMPKGSKVIIKTYE